MKITWKTFKWFIFAGLLPALFFKIQHFYFEGFASDFNIFRDFILWLIISVVLTSSIAYVVLSEIIWLEKKLPWKKHQLIRVVVEVVLTNVTVIAAMVIVNFFMYPLHDFLHMNHSFTFKEHLFQEITMGIVINALLVSLAEGVFFFNQWKDSVLLSERLQKENMQSQLEVLKSQVNPHFLFNSLNVLSSLVHDDADKAEEFIDEFASVYRYILNIQGRTVVSLREELHFLDSYVFLQKIRFEEGLNMHLHIDEAYLNKYLPPLSLQMLVENAIKHNVVGKEQPLDIKISVEKDKLAIVNTLQVRQVEASGTGMGLKNLRERYFRIAGLEPEFKKTEKEYVALIPLFEGDHTDVIQPKVSDSFKCHSFKMGIFKSNCKCHKHHL